MTGHDLPIISGKRYNTWCHRHGLVCEDQDRYHRAQAVFHKKGLSSSEKAALYLHELTGCDGLEFVAFSNARLKKYVMLANGVILVPCFLSQTEGQSAQDLLARLTMRMEQKCRFIYDGWIPIVTWDEATIRKVIRSVDEALSIFCLRGRTSFDWEPKYPVPDETSSTYEFEGRHILELERVSKLLDSLGQNDRVALYRSLAWLSRGLRLDDPAARFLFSVLAIESLATYIEDHASDESPLVVLRAQRLTQTERRANRDKCIRDILPELLPSNPVEAIKTAYFDCVVGIKQRLKTHLRRIFISDPETIMLLFEQKVEGKSLYDLRNDIAHGTTDALSEVQREQIRRRIWDVERFARGYLLVVLQTALGAKPFSKGMQASLFVSVQNAVVSSEGMYKGPTHMAIVYS